MLLNFPCYNLAAHDILNYYEGYVISYMLRYDKRLETSDTKYLDRMLEHTFKLHSFLEDELDQHYLFSKKAAKAELFDLLKGALNDYRIESIYEPAILNVIEEYNEKEYNDFCEKITKSEEEFKSTTQYKLEHRTEYEESFFSNSKLPFLKEKKVSSKFHCIEEIPKLVDITYLPQYYDLLDRVLNSFKNAMSRYFRRYKGGKIHSNQNVVIDKNKGQKLIETSDNPFETKKIKVNLTWEQTAFLFRMLYEVDVFEAKKIEELRDFLASNFITNKTRSKSKGGSSDYIGNLLSTKNPDTIIFWTKKLIEIQNNLKKIK